MESNIEKLFASIPQSEEEMGKIRAMIAQNDLSKLIEKAHKINERVEKAKAMVRMFETAAFKDFWKLAHDDLDEITRVSVDQIKGEPGEGKRFDPFGQMAQLNLIQGGLDLLQSQEIQMQIIRQVAKSDPVDVEELEAKLKAINHA